MISRAARFWSKVDSSGGPDACTSWRAAKAWNGYGLFHAEGRMWRAHRIAWMLANGPIPDGLVVCHACDNPPCVNVKHLWIGTIQEDMADRDRKGRQAFGDKNGTRIYPERYRGVKNGRAKLTEAQVMEIRASSDLHRVLAARYGVGETTIARVKNREQWKHIQEVKP